MVLLNSSIQESTVVQNETTREFFEEGESSHIEQQSAVLEDRIMPEADFHQARKNEMAPLDD